MPRRSLLVSLTCALLSVSGGLARAAGGGAQIPGPLNYDVVVVGAGTGGTAAAIQAARMGRTVALLDRTDDIGGQMIAAGVTGIDTFHFDLRSGIFGEFVNRVEQFYQAPPTPRPLGTCLRGAGEICFEPHVGRQQLEGMLTGVARYPRARVVAVLSSVDPVSGRPRVTGLTVQYGGGLRQFNAKVVIDATETSYVLALSPARYRAGRGTSDALDPEACIDSVTYVATVRRYPPQLGQTPAVPPALVMTDDPPPGNYDEVVDDFEAVVGSGGSDCDGLPACAPCPKWSWRKHNRYRGMPDSKNPVPYDGGATPADLDRISRTGLNFANDYPFFVKDLFPANEFTANCRAKMLTMQYLYYMQSDLQPYGVPSWAVADDEGYGTPFNVADNNCPEILDDAVEQNLPTIPYYRESLRLIGMHTLTAAEIFREPFAPGQYRARTQFASAVALGDYPVDLHGCVQPGDLDAGDTLCDLPPTVPLPPCDPCASSTQVCGQCRFGYFVPGPFQVPFESLVPETVDGLLAGDKNVSASRLAAGALRLQPPTMLIGQAAGAIAALSVQYSTPSRYVAPRFLPPVLVQNALLAKTASDRPPASVSVYKYQDVPRENPHWGGVQMVSTHKIMVGDGVGTFLVGNPVDRALAAVVTATLRGLPLPECAAPYPFNDVMGTPYEYACRHIKAVAQAGITAGCGGGAYCPGQPLPREQEAVMMVLGMGLPAPLPPPPGEVSPFADVPTTSGFYRWIKAAYLEGIMVPCSTQIGGMSFCPAGIPTRGDYADDIARALVGQGVKQVQALP